MDEKYYTSYRTAATWIGSLILYNKIDELDTEILENFVDWSKIVDEDGEYKAIYQWYITDWTEDDVSWLGEHFPELIISYSPMLELFFLAVPFFGMSWDDVPTECHPDWAEHHKDKLIDRGE